MKHVLESLKSEFITISDDDKKYVVRTWHVLVLSLVVGWLLG